MQVELTSVAQIISFWLFAMERSPSWTPTVITLFILTFKRCYMSRTLWTFLSHMFWKQHFQHCVLW